MSWGSLLGDGGWETGKGLYRGVIGVIEALYLGDPDGNGLELYWDRPREEWPRDEAGGLAMFTRALKWPGGGLA